MTSTLEMLERLSELEANEKASPDSGRTRMKEDHDEMIRERDRWVSLAFAATVIASHSDDVFRRRILERALEKFRGVPDQQPAPDDPQYPAYAVKMLLDVLIDKLGVQEAGEATRSHFRHTMEFDDGAVP
jgi:hypothetical protein